MIPFIQQLHNRTIQPHVRFSHLCTDPLFIPNRFIYDHEMILVLKGSGTIISEEHSLPYEPGTLLLIPPGIKHGFYDETCIHYSHIAIHYDWVPHPIHSLKHDYLLTEGDEVGISPIEQGSVWLSSIVILPNIPPDLQRLFHTIADEFQANNPFRLLALQASLEWLLLHLIRLIHQNELSFLELDRSELSLGLQHKERKEMLEVVEKIQLLVDQPPITKEGFDRICDLTHFSITHFRRLFKEHTGFTPHSYFTLLRLNKATELLGNTKLMLKDIAYLCGYEDEKYFNKLFRQKEGMSPQEYRSSILKM